MECQLQPNVKHRGARHHYSQTQHISTMMTPGECHCDQNRRIKYLRRANKSKRFEHGGPQRRSVRVNGIANGLIEENLLPPAYQNCQPSEHRQRHPPHLGGPHSGNPQPPVVQIPRAIAEQFGTQLGFGGLHHLLGQLRLIEHIQPIS